MNGLHDLLTARLQFIDQQILRSVVACATIVTLAECFEFGNLVEVALRDNIPRLCHQLLQLPLSAFVSISFTGL